MQTATDLSSGHTSAAPTILLGPEYFKLLPPATFQAPAGGRAGRIAGRRAEEQGQGPRPLWVRTRDTPIAEAAIKRAQQQETKVRRAVLSEVPDTETLKGGLQGRKGVLSEKEGVSKDCKLVKWSATVEGALQGALTHTHRDKSALSVKSKDTEIKEEELNDLDCSPGDTSSAHLLHNNISTTQDPLPLESAPAMWTGHSPQLSGGTYQDRLGGVPSTTSDNTLAVILQEEEFGQVSNTPTQGVATGYTPPQGVATGYAPPQGVATGYAPPQGVATGYAPPQGVATGYAPPRGVATGYTPPQGVATGYMPPQGVATGYTPPRGVATGYTPSQGMGDVAKDTIRQDGIPNTTNDFLLAELLQENEPCCTPHYPQPRTVRQDSDTANDLCLAQLLQSDEQSAAYHNTPPQTKPKAVGGAEGSGRGPDRDYELARHMQEKMDAEMARHMQRESEWRNDHTFQAPGASGDTHAYCEDCPVCTRCRGGIVRSPVRGATRQEQELGTTYEDLLELEDVSHGVDEKTLSRLSVTHTYKDRPGASEDTRSCAICITEFVTDDLVRRLPCLHTFHVPCVDHWLEDHTSCPVCMKDIKELKMPAPS